MNRKVTILISAMLLVLALAAVAQEKPNPKEALRWYPDGTYARFGLYETAALREAEAYAVFKQMFAMSGDSMFGMDVPVSEEFTDKADYFCFAHIITPTNAEAQSKLRAEIEKAVEGKERGEIDEEKLERLTERMKRHHESDRLWIFSVPELDLLVETALKNNSFARSGKKILGRPLYALRDSGNNDRKGSEANMYAWASAGGELLVADKPETVLSMVSAGEGGGMRMIDNQKYSAFLGYVKEFGHVWNVEAPQVEKELTLEQLRDSAAEEEKLRKMEDELVRTEIYEMQNFFITDIIVMSDSKVYADEEVAQKKYREQSGSLRKAASELKREGKESIPEEEMEKLNERERRMVNKALGFAGNLLESQETTIDGTVVTTTITFGKKQLRTLGQLMAFAKMMEEKEEKKEARENAEDVDR